MWLECLKRNLTTSQQVVCKKNAQLHLCWNIVYMKALMKDDTWTITATMLVGLRDDRVNITHRMPPGLHGKSTRENFRGACSNSFVDINETLTAHCDVKHGLHE